LQVEKIRIKKDITLSILKLGTANFIMQGTNFFVQVSCNTMLQSYGGDLFVGIMTVANSIR
jgi:Na+-driven multidrug efflux pump